MLCGHLDVVAADAEGFRPSIRDGRLHGRGSSDMKGGLAAAIVAAERIAAGPPVGGDLLVAAVIDEEWVSAGAEALARRYRADAAILPEQSDLDVIVESPAALAPLIDQAGAPRNVDATAQALLLRAGEVERAALASFRKSRLPGGEQEIS